MNEIIDMRRDADKAEKAEAWKQIKQTSQDMADFIITVTEVFGSPQRVRVKAK